MPYAKGEPFVQAFFDANGDPLVNGTVEFYIWNTSTPTAVYSDASGTSAGTSVTLDSNGAPSNSGTPIDLYFDVSVVYKIIRKDSAGSPIAPTIGPYYGTGVGGGYVALSIDAVDSGASDSLYDYIGVEDGQQVTVAGYYTPGDGGGGSFWWDSDSSDTDDGGATILPTGHASAGRWKRIFKDKVSIRDFGAKGDNSTDDASSIQKAVTFADTSGLQEVFIPDGNFVIGTTIEVPIGINIRGVGTNVSVLKSKSAATYYDNSGTLVAGASGGFLFFMNVDPAAPTTWITSFPNMKSGGVENVFIDGENTTGINAFFFAGGHYFRDIQATYVNTVIEKPNVYTDGVQIHRVHSQDTRPNTTDYFVSLNGLGDGYSIDYLTSGYANAGVPTKNIYLTISRGGSIKNLINGVCYFEGTSATTISNGHFETGGIILDSCDVVVENNNFFCEDDNLSQTYGISVVNTKGDTTDISRHHSVIRDNAFIRMPNNRGGWPATDKPDIDIDSASAVTLSNNVRKLSISGLVSVQQTMAALVGQSGSILSSWQNYAHLLCGGAFFSGDGATYTGGGPKIKSFTGFQSATATMKDYSARSWTFSGASDTYYYSIQMISDPVRLIGRNATGTAEATATATNGGDIVTVQANKGSNAYLGKRIYRLYRGTSTGSYDKYVDIPAVNCWRFYDDGIGVNGFPWQSRSAGAVDTLNAGGYAGSFTMDDGVINLDFETTNASPTVGTWTIGDRVNKIDPVVPSVGSTVVTKVLRLTTGSGHVDGTDWLRITDERA